MRTNEAGVLREAVQFNSHASHHQKTRQPQDTALKILSSVQTIEHLAECVSYAPCIAIHHLLVSSLSWYRIAINK